TLEPTPGADDLEQAIHELSPGLGKKEAPAAVQGAFGDIGDLLDATEAVIVVVPSDGAAPYQGYVYDINGGLELADAQVTIGERDPGDALAELAKKRYAQISFEPAKPPPPP